MPQRACSRPAWQALLSPPLAAHSAAHKPLSCTLHCTAAGPRRARRLFSLGVLCYLDRTNLSFAALELNRDLGLSCSTYGLGAALFFVSYALFQMWVPGVWGGGGGTGLGGGKS